MNKEQMPPRGSVPRITKSLIRESTHLDFSQQDLFLHNRMSKTMHWSIPWADLMMTMFILFAIMYVFQLSSRNVMANKEKESTVNTNSKLSAQVVAQDTGESAGNLRESLSDIYDLTDNTVKANALEGFASVNLVPDKAVRIILTGDLLFDTGKAVLKPGAKRKLKGIADVIRRTHYMVNVVGHTDNVPIYSGKFPTNWELSATRACEVARFLIEEMEVSAKRFYVSAHSYYQPMFSNDSNKTRASNRRVEIIMTRERPYERLETEKTRLGQALVGGAPRSTVDLWPWNTFL